MVKSFSAKKDILEKIRKENGKPIPFDSNIVIEMDKDLKKIHEENLEKSIMSEISARNVFLD